jgi:hypothetical protein
MSERAEAVRDLLFPGLWAAATKFDLPGVEAAFIMSEDRASFALQLYHKPSDRVLELKPLFTPDEMANGAFQYRWNRVEVLFTIFAVLIA